MITGLGANVIYNDSLYMTYTYILPYTVTIAVLDITDIDPLFTVHT